MIGEDAVEQRLVPILQGGETDVALQIVGLAADVLEFEFDLLLDRHDASRQQSAEAEGVALLFGERWPLVEKAMTDQVPSAAARSETAARYLKSALKGPRCPLGAGAARRPGLDWRRGNSALEWEGSAVACSCHERATRRLVGVIATSSPLVLPRRKRSMPDNPREPTTMRSAPISAARTVSCSLARPWAACAVASNPAARSRAAASLASASAASLAS